MSDVTSSSITLEWKPVECIQHNGDISGYSLRYGVQESGNKQTLNVSGGVNVSEAVILHLDASVRYSIEVAAVNSAGIGVYSSSLIILTLAPHICASEVEVPLYPGSKIVYNWTETEAGNLRRQACPHTCQDYISYPTGAMLETVSTGGEQSSVASCGPDWMQF